MKNEQPHISVLMNEVIDSLRIKDNGTYLDCTFGAGGHSRAILEAAQDVQLHAIDRDESVIKYVDDLKRDYSEVIKFHVGAYGQVDQLLRTYEQNANVGQVGFDGILMDIGVSSMQLDEAERGFSFSKEAPLDMRMNSGDTVTASSLIDNTSEGDLANIIFEYGDERKSRRIARAIKMADDIQTTTELAEIVRKAVGKHNGDTHPATRTFQAIRIAVNDELNQLSQGIDKAIKLLNPNGRLVIITFHSGEDKIVKTAFKRLAGELETKSRHVPDFMSSNVEKSDFKIVTRKAIKPKSAEIEVNPRARSSKLRVLERI